MTTVGKITDGTGSSASSADKTAVSRFTSAASGTLTAGRARAWMTGGGSASTRLVVYANSGSAPGALLAQSDVNTVASTAEAPQDYVFSGANRITIANGTDYWIGLTWQDPGAGSLNLSRDGTASGRQESATYLPNPFGTPTPLTGPIDVYVDVTGSGEGGSLRVGGAAVQTLRVGSTAAVRAYLGSTLLWGLAP